MWKFRGPGFDRDFCSIFYTPCRIIFTRLVIQENGFSPAQNILGKQGKISLVEISAFCRGCPITELTLQIAEKFPNATVTAMKQAVMSKIQSIALFKSFSLGVSLLVITIGALLVMVTMMGSVNQRTREIGIFRAIGFHQGHVMQIILLEALLLGALIRPTSGKVVVDSMDLYSLDKEQQADFRSEYIGFVFQSFQLISYLTVLENVGLPMAVTGLKKKKKRDMAMAVIDRVGLADKQDRLLDRLSGGEQERVAIARAIVNQPPLILADEPTGNLDTDTAGRIMELLASLNREGHTIVVVTHNPETETYVSRNIRVKDGRLDSTPKTAPAWAAEPG